MCLPAAPTCVPCYRVGVPDVCVFDPFDNLYAGLARSLNTSRSLTQGVGTVHYMPPEAMDPFAFDSFKPPGSSDLDRCV
jgi:hypothetical protein